MTGEEGRGCGVAMLIIGFAAAVFWVFVAIAVWNVLT